MIFGLVVNPRTADALVADASYRRRSQRKSNAKDLPVPRILLRDLTGMAVGEGHYDPDDQVTEVTGCLRVHVDGVEPTGVGLGTSLYTALCMGDWAMVSGKLPIAEDVLDKLSAPGGVSSYLEGRNQAADEWWLRAQLMGLAIEEPYIYGRIASVYPWENAVSARLHLAVCERPEFTSVSLACYL